MAELRSRRRLTVLDGVRVLGRDVLIEAASKRDIDGLHAAADTQHWYIGSLGQLRHLQLEGCAPLAHHAEPVTLPLSIQLGSEVRAAARQQKTVNLGEESPPGAKLCDEREHEGNATEVFDGAHVPGPEEICGLAPAPLFSVTGVEIWCHADERFHWFSE